MFLLSPAWLLGLGALALPVLLHLISRGRHRRVRVGSIRLIPSGESRRGSSLRPTQLLLLLVRCLLLAAVALALAGLRWWAPPVPPAAEAGPPWVLVSPAILEDRARLEATDPGPFRRLDRLREEGAAVRLLSAGFPARLPAGETEAGDLWSLLREADRTAPPGIPFHLFAGPRLAALGGERPRLARPVTWTAVASGRNRWIERADHGDGGTLAVVLASSSAERTTFRRRAVAPAGDDELEVLPGPRLRLRDGGTLAGDDELVLGPASPLEVEVRFANQRRGDAVRIRAALEAVSAFTGVPLRLRQRPLEGAGTGGPPGPAGLRFWLSAAPVPEPLLAALSRGGTLVSDGLGTHRSVDVPVLVPGGTIRLRRTSPVEEAAPAAPVWSDPFGRALLEAARVGDGRWYRFHGRFDPSWSDLTRTPAFPAWLASLVEERSTAGSARSPRSDRRAAAAAQLLPAPAGPREAPRRSPSRIPEALLWIAVAALLAVERRMAARVPA